MLIGLGLRLRIFLFFAALAAVVPLALLAGAVTGPQIWSQLALAGGLIWAALALVWWLFDTHVARPIDRLAGALRARATADLPASLDRDLARYLGDLAPAAAAAAQSLAASRNALAETVARETTRLAQDRARLHALLADLPAAVLVVSARQRLVAYNAAAANLLGGALPLALGRPLADWIAAPDLAALGRLAPGEVAPVTGPPAGVMRRLSGEEGYLLLFPAAPAAPAAPAPRPLACDFALLDPPDDAALADTPLNALTYVVFDSETTGLFPAQGDEMVQLAGLRLVNLHPVPGEVFDTLVNPGRPIPPGATAVHGISDAMVADAPPVVQAVRGFHRFARDAVLVAHNAPFDLAFLHRQEIAAGLRFDHPVLDTVLLSAIVFDRETDHSLDALTRRLGIAIPEDARHSALGDAAATAAALRVLVPLLQARGLVSFGDVRAAMRRHGRLVADMNG